MEKYFLYIQSQANLLDIQLTCDNPDFYVSGGQESDSIHESHKLLASQNVSNEYASCPDKGCA